MQRRETKQKQAFRPVLCEPLEDRRLLAVGVAVIGDSDSDEYAFHPPHRITAQNYVELLAQSGKVNFGQYTAHSRGVPEGPGYLYNWARGGDTTTKAIADGQLTGVVKQVAARKVSTVIVFIGSDDILVAIRSANPLTALENAAQAVETNTATIVARLQKANANVKIVLSTVADVGLLPDTQSLVAHGSIPAAALAAERNDIAAINASLRQLAAANKHIAIADVARELKTRLAGPTLKVAGASINTRVPADAPNHFFLADGVHMGTIAQGFVADLFVKTMNSAFNAGIHPFSTTQIRHLANL
jgi:lysophospholipase L1-like esterase